MTPIQAHGVQQRQERDDEHAAHPPLTTVRQPIAEAGRALVRAPLGLIEAI